LYFSSFFVILKARKQGKGVCAMKNCPVKNCPAKTRATVATIVAAVLAAVAVAVLILHFFPQILPSHGDEA
jgi:hypothetical protein